MIGRRKNYFGYPVSINKNTIVIVASYLDDKGFNSGGSYTFELSNGKWREIRKSVVEDP